MVRKEPEDILFDNGLAKLEPLQDENDQIVKKEFKVTCERTNRNQRIVTAKADSDNYKYTLTWNKTSGHFRLKDTKFAIEQ